MTKNTARTLKKHGEYLCARAYTLNRDGEGCSTIGIYLGVHWKTADSLVNAGRELANLYAAAAVEGTCLSVGGELVAIPND